MARRVIREPRTDRLLKLHLVQPATRPAPPGAIGRWLLGFVMTDFVITITLSAADATAHLLENPFVPAFLDGHQVAVTLALVALLGVVFLKGFKEAIGIAVVLVGVYLVLNAIVVGDG